MIKSFECNRSSGALGQLYCVVPVINGTLICCDYGFIFRTKKQKEIVLSWESLERELLRLCDRPNVKSFKK